MTKIYKVVAEHSYVEPEYWDVQYFSTPKKAWQYVEQVACEREEDEEARQKIRDYYEVYVIELDGAIVPREKPKVETTTA